MKCKIVFNDGTYFIGRLVNWWEKLIIGETKGTHHWIVLNSGSISDDILGKRIAVPINSMKYLIIL